MKERLKGLPQIDAVMESDQSPEYAAGLVDELLRFYTFKQIAAHTGISKRGLIHMRLHGCKRFGSQLALEILARRRMLVE